jgi:hypothetical protein
MKYIKSIFLLLSFFWIQGVEAKIAKEVQNLTQDEAKKLPSYIGSLPLKEQRQLAEDAKKSKLIISDNSKKGDVQQNLAALMQKDIDIVVGHSVQRGLYYATSKTPKRAVVILSNKGGSAQGMYDRFVSWAGVGGYISPPKDTIFIFLPTTEVSKEDSKKLEEVINIIKRSFLKTSWKYDSDEHDHIVLVGVGDGGTLAIDCACNKHKLVKGVLSYGGKFVRKETMFLSRPELAVIYENSQEGINSANKIKEEFSDATLIKNENNSTYQGYKVVNNWLNFYDEKQGAAAGG